MPQLHLPRKAFAALSAVLLLAALGAGSWAWKAASAASIVVEWTTASELDLAGFNLYRSSSPEGPYERINPSMIPGSTDSLTGGDYSYTDRGLQPGRMYYYQLEDVETGGAATRTEPIEIRAQAGGALEGLAAVLLLALSGACLRQSLAGRQAGLAAPAAEA
jgi:hypothetical protein